MAGEVEGLRCLLFATERYAGPILAPLEAAIRRKGGEVRWWCVEGAAALSTEAAPRLASAAEAVAYRPDLVFSAANWVPHYLPGVKAQVFHGFNVEKRDAHRGHFRLRGLFDLYCTQGPATTVPFRELAERHGHFHVHETGWPKLDPLFDGSLSTLEPAAVGRPVVLFGSTFTPRLSAAPVLLATLRTLIARGDRYWLLTLHPKCPQDLVRAFRALAGPNARYVEPEALMEAQARAAVLVADTSSIVSEFVVQHKPVVTFRNRVPRPHMLNVTDPSDLDAAIEHALRPEPGLLERIRSWAAHIHPYRDGRSAERVLEAAQALHQGKVRPPRRKPLNPWRKLQVRARTGYWWP